MKKNRTRRTFLFQPLTLVVSIVLFCTVCVVAVRFVNTMPDRVSDWDPDALQAKREAPENACHSIMEAFKSLPEPPEPLMEPHPSDENVLIPYWTEKGSIGRLVDVNRPDDDPLMAAYFERMPPLIAKLQEAVKQPYYLHAGEKSEFGYHALHQGVALINVLIARSRHAYEIGEDPAACYETFFLLLKLSALLSQDADEYRRNASVFNDTLMRSTFRYVTVFNTEQLTALQHWLQETPALPHDNSYYLHLKWYRLDNEIRQPIREYNFALKVDSWWYKWKMSRAIHRIHQQKAANLESIAMRYTEYREAHPGFEWHHGMWYEPENVVLRTHRDIAYVEQRHTAMQLVVALERWHRDTGAYPESLDQLAPAVLECIPTDPLVGTSFGYYRDKDRYVLYSFGENGVDDGGNYIVKRNGEVHSESRRDLILVAPGIGIPW